jgi:hypothetical protein
MRRVCFDIESNYYWNGMQGYLNGPADARAVFSGHHFRFDVATAFVYETQKSLDFTDPAKLFECLLEADEIITFNGRTCDLIVLESFMGQDALRLLWQKPHHDLKGWQGHQKLEGAVRQLLPQQSETYDQILSARELELTNTTHSLFIRNKLARAFRDARVTLDLFQLYQASGDTESTFRDGDK